MTMWMMEGNSLTTCSRVLTLYLRPSCSSSCSLSVALYPQTNLVLWPFGHQNTTQYSLTRERASWDQITSLCESCALSSLDALAQQFITFFFTSVVSAVRAACKSSLNVSIFFPSKHVPFLSLSLIFLPSLLPFFLSQFLDSSCGKMKYFFFMFALRKVPVLVLG